MLQTYAKITKVNPFGTILPSQWHSFANVVAFLCHRQGIFVPSRWHSFANRYALLCQGDGILVFKIHHRVKGEITGAEAPCKSAKWVRMDRSMMATDVF